MSDEGFVMPMSTDEFNKSVMKRRKDVGSSGEYLVAHRLSLSGALISFPVTTAPKYDLVADFDGLLLRVQVKTRTRSGLSKVSIPTGSYRDYKKSFTSYGKLSRKYKRGDFDLLAAVDLKNDTILFVPESYLDYSVVAIFPSEEDIVMFSDIKKVLDNLSKT